MNNDLKLIVKRIDELTDEEYIAISEVKMEFWHFPVDSQIKWMKEHYKPDDIIILAYNESGCFVGSAALPKIKFYINDVLTEFIGPSCFCVSDKFQKHGYGRFITDEAVRIIKQSKEKAILLCHRHLVNHYIKSGFSELKIQNVTLEGKEFEHCVMTININNDEITKLDIPCNF